MLLVIDIGNTNIVTGVYRDGSDQLLYHWRLSTDPERTADEYGLLFDGLFSYDGLDLRQVRAVAISSVVPPLTPVLERMAEKYLKGTPLVVGPGIKTGMNILYEDPKEVGADRIVNGVAAYAKYGGPIIVVDFGTATTFDAISAEGAYLGGAIAPGIGISTEALFEHAAKLSRIELARPKSVIGRTTVASMQSGIIFGFAGQVDELVRRMRRELGGQCRTVATGGFAELISKETSTLEVVDPFLTLDGLRLVYLRNRD
ncbi:MAG: type III pantothenate kinase [Bacillota bacterium]|jgi:type III pantothenate kinase|nr:MAG: type III pantothenate kinase [Bacillota bacterium]